VVVDDVLLELEGFDRDLAVALAVGEAEQEPRGAQADVAGVLVVAEAVPAGVLRALEGGLEVFDPREFGVVAQAEQAGAGVGEEGDVGHRADGGAVLEDLEVGGAAVGVEGGADDPVGLAAEDAEGAAVEVFVEAGLGGVGGVLGVGAEVVLGGVDDLEADIFAEVDALDEVLDASPGGLEVLDLGVVEDRVDLGGQAAVEVGDEVVDAVLVDARGRLGGAEQVVEEGAGAGADELVGLAVGGDEAGLGEQGAEQRGLVGGGLHGGGVLLRWSRRSRARGAGGRAARAPLKVRGSCGRTRGR
jgi:hypothetical protein